MAILKHIASKNADYGEAQRYLIFRHDEYTGKPIPDADGNLQLREEYYLDGVECDPFTFDVECKELNARFHKNRTYDEIKSHHYIISFDPKDRDGRSGLGWNIAGRISPDIRPLSAPTRTGITEAATSMCISSSTACGKMT